MARPNRTRTRPEAELELEIILSRTFLSRTGTVTEPIYFTHLEPEPKWNLYLFGSGCLVI